MWHTPWDEGAPGFPHELMVELPKPVILAGLTCLPRQDMRNGWIKDYAVELSDDGKIWCEVARGQFARDNALKTVKLAQPAKARCLRLVARSGCEPKKPYASLAELTIITQP